MAQAKPVQQQSIFTKEEAELYHGSRSGFFSLLTGSQSGKQQRSYPLTQLATVLPLVNPKQDTWLSQAEFFRPNRRVVNLARLGLLFVDLDYYQIPKLAGTSPESMAWLLRNYCRNEAMIPQPSLIVASGQGLQVKWLLDGTIPRQALPRWNACQRRLVDALARFGADPAAKDASRVLRLVNTVNTKNGQVCRIVDVLNGRDGQPLRYPFDTLADDLLPVARWDIENERQELAARKEHFKAVQGGRKGLLKGFSGSRLAWDRLNDLRQLASLRGGVQEGERMLHLHWQLNFLLLSGATHSSQMYHEARELARQIAPGWKHAEAELSTLYRKAQAYNAGEKVEFNGEKYPALYTPRNDTLINLFRITDAEQRQLQTIISKDEKAAREKIRNKERDAKRKGWTQSRVEYEGEAQARTKEVLKMKSQGFKYAYIAEKMSVSVNAVKGIVKRAKASGIKG